MEQNPYESPAPSKREPTRRVKYFFRGLAVVSWFVAFKVIMMFSNTVNTQGDVGHRETAPFEYWGVTTVMFFFPAIGFVLLGIASWRRDGLIALAGMSAFVPLIFLIVAVIVWDI